MASAPNILPVVASAQVKAKKRKAVDFDLLVQRDIKALLEKQGTQGTQAFYTHVGCKINIYLHLGDSSQHVTEDLMVTLNSLKDLPPSEKTSSVIEFQHISAQDACEDQNMAAPDPFTDSLPCQDMSASAEPQGTSSPVCEDQKMADLDQITELLPSQDFAAAEPQGTSPPGCEDQKMAGFDQITEPLPSQDASAAFEPQGTSPSSEDQIMVAPDQIVEPLLSQDMSPAASPQGTSSQIVAENREMTPPDSVRGSSIPNEPQDYSSQTIIQDQEMKAVDITEASLPSLDASVATEPQNSSWQPITEEQGKQETAAGDSGDSASLPSQKTISAIETKESAATSISDENVTGSLRSSPQGKARNSNPLVSSNHVGNIPSPVQDVRPLTPSASADNLVKGSPRSTIPGETSWLFHMFNY